MSKKPDTNVKKELEQKIEKIHKSTFLTEFKEFINRGSVVDLAVGVIVGGAVGKIVASLVNDIIMPLVSLIIGGIDFTNLEITIPNIFGTTSAAHIRYGVFIQNVVDFLIVAFVIFLMVRAVNKISKKADQAKKEAVETQDDQLTVLKEIRDLLKKQK